MDLTGVALLRRPQTEPAEKRSAGFVICRPEAKAGETLIVAQKAGQDLALNDLAWRRYTSAEKTHDRRVPVQLKQVTGVVRREAAQDQALGLDRGRRWLGL